MWTSANCKTQLTGAAVLYIWRTCKGLILAWCSAEERGATLQAKKQHRDEVRQKRREERLRAGVSVAHSEGSSSASTSVANKQETDDLDMDLLAEHYVDQPR